MFTYFNSFLDFAAADKLLLLTAFAATSSANLCSCNSLALSVRISSCETIFLNYQTILLFAIVKHIYEL